MSLYFIFGLFCWGIFSIYCFCFVFILICTLRCLCVCLFFCFFATVAFGGSSRSHPPDKLDVLRDLVGPGPTHKDVEEVGPTHSQQLHLPLAGDRGRPPGVVKQRQFLHRKYRRHKVHKGQNKVYVLLYCT